MMSELKRIANALEIIAKTSGPLPNETIAAIHETYAEHVTTILESNQNTFEMMKSFRALVILARQTAIQIRDN